jgi:hypothetical protein
VRRRTRIRRRKCWRKEEEEEEEGNTLPFVCPGTSPALLHLIDVPSQRPTRERHGIALSETVWRGRRHKEWRLGGE